MNSNAPRPYGIDVNRRTLLGAGALIALGSLAGCLGRGRLADDETTDMIERSFAAPTVREVRVSNTIGDVTVAAHGTGDVEAQVLKRSRRGQAGLDDLDVRIDLTGGVLTVETQLTRRDFWVSRETPRADVTVTLPEGPTAPVVTDIATDLGDVTLLGTRGDTRVHTDLGDVTVSGADGYLSLSSNLGTVLASDVTGLETVRTDLGDVKVDLLDLRSDVEIGTQLGSVVVGVAEDLDLDLLAETTGSLDSNLPLTGRRTSGSRLTGRLNDGGRRLHVFSELGDVSLRSVSR